MMLRLALVLALIAACNKENRKTCEQAFTRYTRCLGELLGPDAEALARAKDGTDQCVRDDATVAMYRKCLPQPSCSQFLQCLEDYVIENAPKLNAKTSR